MLYQQLSALDLIKQLEFVENFLLDRSEFLSIDIATIELDKPEEEVLNIVNLGLKIEVVKNYIPLNANNKLTIGNYYNFPITLLIRKLKRHPKIKAIGAENYATYYKVENRNCPIVNMDVKAYPSIPPILYFYVSNIEER